MILAPRYLPRLAATIGLFTRYGLADFARQQGLQGIAPEPGEEGAEGPSPEKACAFRKRLVELGPAFVKLGQVLSTRPDLLPDTYIRELEKLQDDVDPIPYPDIERIIEEELKGRISKLFADFEQEPVGSASLGQLMNEVLPPGVINVVTGGGDVGNHMANHSGIDKVVFTGSVATGKKVMESASRSLKRVTLELGGNDAGVVLPGTNIEPLLDKLFWGCFINAGQTCAALKRLYVHESQYEDVVAKLAAYVEKIPVGDGLDPQTLIGPVSNKMQLDKVESLVEDARKQGARIVTGGKKSNARGFTYPLTVIADATDDMRVVKEEQFGPVIPVVKYRDVDDAIRRANALEVGLGGSVWGNDVEQASQLAARLECGTAWVNQHGTLHPLAPFGGVKCSGIGVEFNVDGLKEYTTVQVVNAARK